MKKTNLVKKLFITLGSMAACMALIGVSVYAALLQTTTLENTITISTRGQARAVVTVYEQVVAGKEAVTSITGLVSDSAWGDAKFTKNADENSADCKNLKAINFDQTTGNRIYAYKITIENQSTVALKVSIDSTVESNTEIDVYFGTTLEATKLENGTKISYVTDGTTNAHIAENNGTGTYYVFVCANTNLADMTAVDSTPFNITVTVEAV